MKNSALTILTLLTIWSCANRVQPTGGPKDEDPPVLLQSIPEDGQRNFTSQQIQLTFDEFINIKNIKEQLIITPRIEGDYEYKIKKKTIILDFESPFSDSTTYTLNFREGIVDITESNPAENLQVAFSTGNLLDTLEITGHVLDLSTRKPIANATVGIYNIDDTLNIFTGAPYYFSRTDKEGNYHFRNIKDGKYKMYAFSDDNKNLTCQSDREAYSFLCEAVVLDTTIIADTLEHQYLNIDTLEITRARSSGRYFLMTANKYLVRANLKASNDSLLYYKFNDERKGLKIYKSFEISDSLKVYATVEDSLGYVAQDTFFIQFPETERKPDEFIVKLNDVNASLLSKKISGELHYDKPLKELFLDSVSINLDTLKRYYVFDSMTYKIDTSESIIEFAIDIPNAILDSLNKKNDNKATQDRRGSARGAGRGISSSKLQYTLSIPKGSLISIENDTSQLINNNLKFNSPTTIGMVRGVINTEYSAYFIQLLDNNFKIVDEQYNGKSYIFNELKPGEYYIRILIDENQNGKWDIANIIENKPAEKVIIYTDEEGNNKTAVRANWEISVDLSF